MAGNTVENSQAPSDVLTHEGDRALYPCSSFLLYRVAHEPCKAALIGIAAAPQSVIVCHDKKSLLDYLHVQQGLPCILANSKDLQDIQVSYPEVPCIGVGDGSISSNSGDLLDYWHSSDYNEIYIRQRLQILPELFQRWLTHQWQKQLLEGSVQQEALTLLTTLRDFFNLSFLGVMIQNDHEAYLHSVETVHQDGFVRRLDRSFPVSLCQELLRTSARSCVHIHHGSFPAPVRQLDEILRFYSCERLLLGQLSPGSYLIGAGTGTMQAHHEYGIESLHVLTPYLHTLPNLCAAPAVAPRVLLDSLGEAVILCDLDDIILDVNSRALSLTGYNREELIGEHAQALLHPFSSTPIASERSHDEVKEYCLPLTQKDGSQRRVRIRASSLRDHQGPYATLASMTDVTDDYINQLRVQQSEKRLRHLFELPLLGIALFDRTLRLTEANPCLLELCNTTLLDIHEQSLTLLFPEQERHRIEQFLAAFLDGDQDACIFESRLLRIDSSPLACSLSLACIRDEDDVISYYVLLALDISKRKQAEENLRKQKDYLAQVLDTLPYPVFARDSDSRYTLANRAFAQLAGIAAEKIQGASHQDLFQQAPLPPVHRHSDRSAIRAGTDGIQFEGPVPYLERASDRWFRTIKKPLRTPNSVPNEILGVTIDLSDQKRAERMLRMVVEGTTRSIDDSFFDLLVKHISSVLSVDHVYIARYDENNPGQVETLAFWQHDTLLPSQIIRTAQTPLESSIGQALRYYQRHVMERFPEDAYVQEHAISTFVAATLFSQSGRPIGILVAMHGHALHDWSLSRWLMNIFATRASAELERSDAEYAASVLQSQLLQSQKMDAIGQLAAGVAHDLNNALHAVSGHLELLSTLNDSDTNVHHRVSLALQGCERASSLINELLGFARQGRYNVQPEDLLTLTHQTVSFLERILGTNIKVQCMMPEAPCIVDIDCSQMQQVLTNLILNAKQAMPDGGTITIEIIKAFQAHPERMNPASKPGEYFALRIQDEGVGIAPEVVPRIFEPFYTTKPAGEGTGLGLAMVYGIMQHHGGWVSVDSRPGEGACFTLHLPVSLSIIEKPIQKEKEAMLPLTHGRILVVDDELMLLDLAETFFSLAGLSVDTCSHPADAISFFQEHHQSIDLVLLDMNMPDMDGAQCFSAMQDINPNVPVILLSGFIDDESVQRTLHHGALTFFQKPVEYKKLLSWVQDFLGNREPSPEATNSDEKS